MLNLSSLEFTSTQSERINSKTMSMVNMLKYMSKDDIMALYNNIESIDSVVFNTDSSILSRICVHVTSYVYKGVAYDTDKKYYVSTGISRTGSTTRGLWLPYTYFDEFDGRLFKPEDVVLTKLQNETYTDEQIIDMFDSVMTFGRYMDLETAVIAKHLTSLKYNEISIS